MTEQADQPMRESLKRVARILKGAQVPFALSGGYASWARGGPEPMHDVDFVLAEEDVEQALRVLSDAGMRVEHPPEDWLEKVYDGDVLIDLIFRPAWRPVTRDQLAAASEVSVDSVLMPVLTATDLLVGKLLVLSEHSCDYAKLFPHARALREQVDWPELRRAVEGSPFARRFLQVCEDLEIVGPEAEGPGVQVNGAEVPDAEVPDAEGPGVQVNDVEVPDVEMPDVEVPDVEVPDVEVPDVEMKA